MVEHLVANQIMGVRFSLPALNKAKEQKWIKVCTVGIKDRWLFIKSVK